ncbi:MAG: hypothetical protein LKE51_00605 [Selenomonas sp.]|nr:hypothetical protein [Selenomonas sp.]
MIIPGSDQYAEYRRKDTGNQVDEPVDQAQILIRFVIGGLRRIPLNAADLQHRIIDIGYFIANDRPDTVRRSG